MKKLIDKLWNTEPVRITTGLTTAWAAIVSFDKMSDAVNINEWIYVVMIAVTIFLGEVTRTVVTAPANMPKPE